MYAVGDTQKLMPTKRLLVSCGFSPFFFFFVGQPLYNVKHISVLIRILGPDISQNRPMSAYMSLTLMLRSHATIKCASVIDAAW